MTPRGLLAGLLIFVGYVVSVPVSAILPDEEPPKPKPAAERPRPKPKPVAKAKPRVVKEQECMSDADGKTWCRDTGASEAASEAGTRSTAGTASRACADCPEMVRIPGGSFMMGSSSGEEGAQEDEKPRHRVEVSSFSLGKYEVTRAQFAAFVDDTGYAAGSSCYTSESGKWEEQSGRSWNNPSFSQGGSHPVVCVSLGDAEAYIRWLNRKTGKQFRLPTEVEWEYAARAGTDTARYWGDEESRACGYANVADQTAGQKISFKETFSCSDGYVYTAPVGSFTANRFGLHDMLGNVWEWTCSDYTEHYDGSEESCGNGARRVNRGGSWGSTPVNVRSANRGRLDTSYRNNSLGFRLAQD